MAMFNSYVSLPEGTPCNSRIFPLKAPWLVGDSQEIATFYHISRWYFPVFRCISPGISTFIHGLMIAPNIPWYFPWYSHENFPSRWDTTAAQLLRRWSAWALSRWKVPLRRGAGLTKKTSLVDDQKVGFQFMNFMGIRIVKHMEI